MLEEVLLFEASTLNVMNRQADDGREKKSGAEIVAKPDLSPKFVN